ncbi:MAG: dihydroorotate dehydrogenase electron transfer subunit [bacterium]|nr:dihydroorotate dehydrogenase electron transfer subunit [bacterium]
MAELIERPEKIAEDHYLLRIRIPGKGPEPGQFVNIKARDGVDPLLRRPFSIFDYENDIYELVIREVGKGTRLIRGAEPGQMDILGPLGKGFTLPQGETVLLAGGGVGNAPLYYLGKKLKEQGNRVVFVYGARTKDFIYLEDRFSAIADSLIIATDDGSAGEKGFVPEAAGKIIEKETFDRIYTCGPTPMMIKMVETAGKIPIEVSLENYFGCGVGLCVGCTVETLDGFKRACIEGPVFDGTFIKWDSVSD